MPTTKGHGLWVGEIHHAWISLAWDYEFDFELMFVHVA
jgi:hypothetical protein